MRRRPCAVVFLRTQSFEERDSASSCSHSAAAFHQTQRVLPGFGSHTDRFASHFGSLSGATGRGSGLERPDIRNCCTIWVGFFRVCVADLQSELESDQLRFVSSARRDHYQVPGRSAAAAGHRHPRHWRIRHGRFLHELLLQVHTPGPGMLWTVSPYYHFTNRHSSTSAARMTSLQPRRITTRRAMLSAAPITPLAITNGRSAGAHFGRIPLRPSTTPCCSASPRTTAATSRCASGRAAGGGGRLRFADDTASN